MYHTTWPYLALQGAEYPIHVGECVQCSRCFGSGDKSSWVSSQSSALDRPSQLQLVDRVVNMTMAQNLSVTSVTPVD